MAPASLFLRALRPGFALAILAQAASAATNPVTPSPWKPSDPPPPAAAAVLGKSQAEVIRMFGKPMRDHPFTDRRSNEFDLFFAKTGLSLAGTPADGVTAAIFCYPEAGSIAGVRVGDPTGSVISKWGAPRTHAGQIGVFRTGSWILQAERDPSDRGLRSMAVIKSPSSLAFPDGQLMLDEFCPHPNGIFPWRAGDSPPVIAGIHLGESRQDIEAAWGKPESTAVPGGGKPFLDEYFLHYPSRGVTVLGMSGDGASAILLRKYSAGSIDGVNVGASLRTLVDRWGVPPSQEDATGIYAAGTWAIMTRLDPKNSRVALMEIGWAAPKWPETAGQKPAGFYHMQ